MGMMKMQKRKGKDFILPPATNVTFFKNRVYNNKITDIAKAIGDLNE